MTGTRIKAFRCCLVPRPGSCLLPPASRLLYIDRHEGYLSCRCPPAPSRRSQLPPASAFLEEQRGCVRTLFLLGDIFDFWIGFRHVVFAPYIPLLEALRQLRESGTAIVYVEGNHDFHLGPYFREILGCRILPAGGGVEIGGQRIFIAHGDLVNPADRGYRLLRRLLRSRPLRLLTFLLPPDLIWEIACRSSRLSSRGHTAKRQRWLPEDLLLAHARERFAEGYQAVVTGHFHTPLLRATEQGTVIGLGDWIEQYSYAVWENGAFSLIGMKTVR